MEAFWINDCDIVVTTDGIEGAKQWYSKEIDEVETIERIDPSKKTMFYAINYDWESQITLVPPNEVGLHQFTVVDGDVIERITIKEAYERDGSPDETYVICSTEW